MIHIENENLKELDIGTILDNMPLNIIITDVDGKILWCNKTTYDFTGYQRQEMTGENPRILKCDKTNPEIYKDLWETIAVKKQIWTGIISNKKKNGEIYEEELRIIPVINEIGDVNLFVGIQRDVTELDELRKRENIKKAISKVVEKIAQINEFKEDD